MVTGDAFLAGANAALDVGPRHLPRVGQAIRGAAAGTGAGGFGSAGSALRNASARPDQPGKRQHRGAGRVGTGAPVSGYAPRARHRQVRRPGVERGGWRTRPRCRFRPCRPSSAMRPCRPGRGAHASGGTPGPFAAETAESAMAGSRRQRLADGARAERRATPSLRPVRKGRRRDEERARPMDLRQLANGDRTAPRRGGASGPRAAFSRRSRPRPARLRPAS